MNSPGTTTRADEPGLPSARVVIGLGSNLSSARGNPHQTVLAAMERLANLIDEPLARSSLWQTEPQDCPPGAPPFINAVVMFPQPRNREPGKFLEQLLQLEGEFGRQAAAVRNAARSLDLDLLCWGDLQCDSRQLVLPHPRAALRDFVLLPLAELDPEFVIPGQALTVTELLRRLPPSAATKIP